MGQLRSLEGAVILCVAAFLLFFSNAWSQTPEVPLRHLNHRAYSALDGAPSDIDALAQTSDGTLWIGSRGGLTRFDGVRFVPYPGRSEEPLHSTNIASLLAAPDGGLWIGFRPAGVSFLEHGHVTRYGEAEGLPSGTVQQLAFDRDGSLWAAARSGLAHLRGTRWETVTDDPRISRPYGVLVDPAGTVWAATANGLFARTAGDIRFHQVDARGYLDPRGGLLASAPDGQVWAVADHELVRGHFPTQSPPADVISLPGISGPFLFDDAGNLWAADVDRGRLHRLPARDLARGELENTSDPPRKLVGADDLSPESVSALLQDREHNIWVGTDSSLHRFSHSNVVRNRVPMCPTTVFNPVVAAGDAGTLWVVCDDDTAGQLHEIRADAVVSRQITPRFSVAYRDTGGTVWFAGPNVLAHLEKGRVLTVPLPAQLQGMYVLALMRDREDAMWVSVNRGGIFRVVNGEWVAYGNLDDLPRGIAYIETAAKDGDLWFGYSNSRVARVRGRTVTVFDEAQGLSVGNVLAIYEQGGEIWVGGELGFARFDGTRFVSMHSASETPLAGVSGIVRARNGDLWLNGIGGIQHIARQELERVIHDPSSRVKCEIFNHLDGVPGLPYQLQGLPSIIEATDGRLWFLTKGGIVSIDPTQLRHNTLPPPVTIWSVSSGSGHFSDVRVPLVLPIHTTDLRVEYGAGSLTVPERVNFRYELEGSDRDWQDVGTRREARYTNLGPGHYTFRVTASNDNGVWNTAGASMTFSILPAFYQTIWFYTLCALACVAMLAALYRVRMLQVAAQVRGRLEARLAERERIARELHDTLLQGIQGLIWRFQAATDRIPAGEPARNMMEQSLDRADQLLAESRDKVKDLRPASRLVTDLAQALAAEAERFSQLHPAQCRVNVQGVCRDLHPIVREEGFLIAREALSNAFCHAGAKAIEAEIIYGDRALHLTIRDDGQGINAAVLDAGGRPGHFGLLGMRERATRLGAHFQLWSKPGAGTEVELRVPADVAYRKTPTRTRTFRLGVKLEMPTVDTEQ